MPRLGPVTVTENGLGLRKARVLGSSGGDSLGGWRGFRREWGERKRSPDTYKANGQGEKTVKGRECSRSWGGRGVRELGFSSRRGGQSSLCVLPPRLV